LRAVPFEPFVVQMNDGRRFEVPHPGFAALSPSGARLIIFREDSDDVAVTLSTLLIASVEPLKGAAR
jgi:hypothetical protein